MNRILITGAAGNLGSHLRKELHGIATTTRLSDIKDMPPATAGEEVMLADVADFNAMAEITKDVDVILHLGGIPIEDSWDNILPNNIVGCYNVWENAHRNGVKRIIFASSNHAIGMYPRTQLLDSDSPARPDTYYGLAKAFGEDLARMYWDKHGIEAACLRIGSCFPEPTDRRMLNTWLSFADFGQLCRRCVEVPNLGYAVVYGVSDNTGRWWNNSKVSFLGYKPEHSADVFRDAMVAKTPTPDPDDPATIYQGGSFAADNFTRKLKAD